MAPQPHSPHFSEVGELRRRIAELTAENQQLSGKISQLELERGHGHVPNQSDSGELQPALPASETHFNELLSHITDVVWSASVPDEKVLYVNPAVERLYGHAPTEFLKNFTLWLDAVHPDDKRIAEASGRDLFTHGKASAEYRIVRPDGECRWIFDRKFLIRDDQGRPLRIGGICTDITDRKQADGQLRRQAQLLDSVQESLVATDLDGRVTYWGRGAQQLYGYSPEEVLGEPITFVVTPAESEDEHDRMRQVREQGSWRGQYLQQKKDGTSFWADTTIALVTDAQGDPSGFVGLDRDITESRRADEAVRASERKYRQIIDTTHEGVWIFDAEERTTFVNEQMATMFGYKVEEMLGRTVFDFVESAAQIEARHNMSCQRRGIREQNDYRFQRKYGGHVWTSMSTNRLFDDDGAFVGMLAMVSDITERKRAEAQLKRANNELELGVRLRTADLMAANQRLEEEIAERRQLDEERGRLISIIEETTDFVAWATADEDVQYLNRAARKALRIPDSVGVSQLRFSTLHPPLTLERLRRDAIPEAARKRVWSGETAWQSWDGAEIPTWQVIHAHRGADGEVELLSTIARDMTALREAEQTQRHLAHMNRVSTMGEMASSMAHELNQPLGTIAANAQAAIRGARSGGMDVENTLEVLADIASEAMRAGQILRNVARFVAKVPPRRTACDINQVVDFVLRMVETDASRHDTRLQLELAPAPCGVQVNEIQIQQVLVNLVRNALDAMEESVSADRTIVIATQSETDRVEVSVSDNGAGVPDEFMDRLFEPYFTTKTGGLGMGLIISRSIVTSHGGQLWATKNRNRGMTFRFTLPREREKNGPGDGPQGVRG